MKLFIYVIWDLVAGDIAANLHVFPVDAVAVRFFGDVSADPKTQIAQHLDDFELRCLGYVEAGVLYPLAEPVVVITGAALRAARDSGRPVPLDGDQLSLLKREA